MLPSSLKKIRPTFASAVVPLAASVVLGGCASGAANSSAAASPTNTVPAITSSVASTPPASPGAAGCPVDAATLEQAVKASAEVGEAIVLGSGLEDIACYGDFAVGRATPTNLEGALVLFAYDKKTGVWTALVAGTSFDCGEFAPADVVPHLTGCPTM